MTREELMKLAAEKAISELQWDSIEFLFRPNNTLELLLRMDFNGMFKKIHEWIGDDAPDAMPHRFRPPYTAMLLHRIRVESFYKILKALHEKNVDEYKNRLHWHKEFAI